MAIIKRGIQGFRHLFSESMSLKTFIVVVKMKRYQSGCAFFSPALTGLPLLDYGFLIDQDKQIVSFIPQQQQQQDSGR